MAAGMVALIGLDRGEAQQLRELVAQHDIEVNAEECSTVAESESLLEERSTLLVVLAIGAVRKRADQDIRRIRRAVSRSVPLLVLLDPEQVRRVREYMRAGADEYWIRPLDDRAFPPRFFVLLECGQSVADAAPKRHRTERWSLFGAIVSLWQFLVRRYRPYWVPPEHNALAEGFAGRWERLRRLGFGSYGEVWLVQHRGQGDLAVAKVPHSKQLNTKFMREAAILRRLFEHPNAVHLREVVKEEEKVVLIQEYVEGATLQELLDQGMEPALRESAFLQLVDVVACAHEQRIMHRDIKPENILITRSGQLKLLDFGTGKDLTRRSISDTVIGSRPYMAPEQIMGQSRLASDVWALGVILYALATGCLPFYDDNEKQLMDLILEVEPEAPRQIEAGLSPDLEGIILRCLRKDWTQRYRDAAELRRELCDRLPAFGQGGVLP